ncbi:MAG: hypothetical protein ABIR15_03450 [Chitinophagaceae bacterium]
MKSASFAIFFFLACFTCAAQQKKAKIFRPAYINFGLNLPSGNFGTAPFTTANVKQNILGGYYGAKQGFLFELGRKIYFNSSDHPFRYGLDWTILSATYNNIDWSNYTSAKGGSIVDSRIISLSSKLGPVVSYNIVKKLVVDAHFQAAPVLQASSFDYYKQSGTSSTEEFIFSTDNISDLFGIKTSAGIGVRWGVIGLSVDYFSGSLNTAYQYTNTDTGEGNGATVVLKQKIPTSSIQLKLSLNL